ncbi:MAG: TIGR00725 family protein [Kiloniellales bacterium]
MLVFDRANGILRDPEGRRFDPVARRWRAARGKPHGDAVTLREALRWLQRDSGQPCRVPIGLIGPRKATARQLRCAETAGAALAELGLTLLCGGREGVMEAACRGVAAAGGLSIGLLPDEHWSSANPYVGVPLASGIGVARNAIIARASLCLVAVGGGNGTLSEIAFALQFGRPVLTLEGAPQVAGVFAYRDWRSLEPALCRIVLGLEPQESPIPGKTATPGVPSDRRRRLPGYAPRAARRTSR